MVTGTFFERIDELSRQIGHNDLVGKIEVNQVYAHIQEVSDEFEHPRGGQSRYLSAPFFDKSDERMETLARRVITPDGSEIERGMADAMEDLADDVFEKAPVEFADLKSSGHPTVTSDGAVVYDRPPDVERLSKDELKAKSRLRGHGLLRHNVPRPPGFVG